MKRRSFLGLLALPLVALVPKAGAELVPPPDALRVGTLVHVVEEEFITLDHYHQCAISWRLSDGTRHAMRMGRMDAPCKRKGFHYPQHCPTVTLQERSLLREEMQAWLEARR